MSLTALEYESRPIGALPICHDDPRWHLALRVAGSQHLKRAPLLASFLLFICEHALTGSHEDLTEQIIGERVFRRRPGYSTGEDNIVRTYAHRLRSRLDQYFEHDGHEESLRIRIPKGGYTPIFEARPVEPGYGECVDPTLLIAEPLLSSSFPTDTASFASASAEGRSSGSMFLIAFVCLVLGASMGLSWTHWSHRHDSPHKSPAHALWAQLFSRQTGTFIVTADNGLGVLQDITGRYTNLHDYMDGSYFAQFGKDGTPEQRTMQRLSRERLTSVPDAAGAAAMLLLPEARDHQVQLRNARALQLSDLKQSNLVLLGSNYGDPWVSLFEPNMNFQINYHATRDTYESEIINRNPRPGEQRVYLNNSTTAPYNTYAIIALMPNLDHSGWVLLIEGLTMAGTEAATEYLLHGNVGALMREVANGSGVRPFEIVLKTTNLDSESSPPSILLKRIY